MARHAADAAMVGGGGSQIVALRNVARSTEPGWHISSRLNLQRLMGRVATQAIFGSLVLLMSRVAVHAAGDLLVAAVTTVAEQLAMAAGRRRHLRSDLLMARQAFLASRLERVTQHRQWLMRVGMALLAIADPVMRLLRMAVRTVGAGIVPLGRMLPMAVQTDNLCCMLAALLVNHFRLERMAFSTVRQIQFCRCGNNRAEDCHSH